MVSYYCFMIPPTPLYSFLASMMGDIAYPSLVHILSKLIWCVDPLKGPLVSHVVNFVGRSHHFQLTLYLILSKSYASPLKIRNPWQGNLFQYGFSLSLGKDKFLPSFSIYDTTLAMFVWLKPSWVKDDLEGYFMGYVMICRFTSCWPMLKDL